MWAAFEFREHEWKSIKWLVTKLQVGFMSPSSGFRWSRAAQYRVTHEVGANKEDRVLVETGANSWTVLIGYFVELEEGGFLSCSRSSRIRQMSALSTSRLAGSFSRRICSSNCSNRRVVSARGSATQPPIYHVKLSAPPIQMAGKVD